MFPLNETLLAGKNAPPAAKPRDRRALSAYRHGMTGQIILLTQADQVAYDHHCRGYHETFRPVGAVEKDVAQIVADDRWRLKQGAALASAIFADGITQPDEVTTGNPEVDTAMAQGKVWVSKGGNLQLLTLYEGRIQRRIEKNMVELRTLQAERKVELRETIQEVDLLCQLAESKGEDYEPSHFASLAKFDFSSTDVARLLLRFRDLREAKKRFQEPKKPTKLVA